ncbi:hypothetical protein Cs7R123_43970 [Catellatospora sp. TT07R-123]|uniref:winged helix DNA-binding domain-containing protein n=1 Tax=Catellatospora sp. TT07R-123 TaxID=2733863 RepID=UPI001B0A866D|nr:winged helix DNA-binding domain-containing protein [Catellatospora sp. TT07R-123]GHJ47055.1 hypothetical protein Cs7R123_43970 [Catellatospora sp. TT07R-123]
MTTPTLGQERVRGMRARAQAIGGGVRHDSAAAVVRRVFAVQAQNAVAAELGIRVRGRCISAEDIRAAYEDDRSIVRNWFMRGTLHTIPSPDARWVQRLLGPRILAGTSRRYHQLGLNDDLRDRSDRLISRALATHGPLTRPELAERLTTLGVDPTGQAPFHLIRHAALSGIACHGPRSASEATFVLFDDWLPATAEDALWQEDAAATELARRYLSAYAPAEVEDFASWSGLPITLARRAWRKLAQSGLITDYGALAAPAGGTNESQDPLSEPDVRMLPAYDNYLTGYRSRELSVPASYQRHVWPGGGLIRPTITADGLAVATWSRRAAGRSISADPFEPLSPQIQIQIGAEMTAVTRFLLPTP